VPLVRDAEPKERVARRAIALLNQAVARGYSDGETLKTRPDLDSLRGREDFKALLRSVEKK
jgi:hypothetical protein